MSEQVILVDSRDRELGVMDKIEAHRLGVLHRAFSIFVFNSKGELLIHRRALGKYHSSGLWTNTCCSHPRPKENTADAANRRLEEEMGMKVKLDEIFSFVYKADLGEGVFEHECDHVFLGRSDENPKPDASEVLEWKWLSVDAISNEIDTHPNDFTIWFQLIFKDVVRVAREK